MKIEQQKIERIQVTKLFNRLDYDIKLSNQNISILIAPNGCGKTTVFTLVNFMFAPTFEEYIRLLDIPFESCICTLSNNKQVVLKSVKIDKIQDNEYFEFYENIYKVRQKVERNNVGRKLIITTLDNDKKEHVMDFSQIIVGTIDFLNDRCNRHIIVEDNYKELKTSSYENMIRTQAFVINVSGMYEMCGISVASNFIRADRVYENNGIASYGLMNYDMMSRKPIVNAQDYIKDLYNDMQEEYSRLQAIAKNELARKYINTDEPVFDYNEFERKWENYVSEVKKYSEIGFINDTDNILKLDNIKEIYKTKGIFLSVYVDVFSETLKAFEDNYPRMKMFIDILNDRNSITNKNYRYCKEGIRIYVNDEILNLEYLSSGEKNDFLMFYNMIFCYKGNNIIFIDEPEISIHIEWQESYIRILSEICKLNNLQAIVATHSPSIVNGHFELLAERGLHDGYE